jgi:DNA-binding MarR family transcriptional regulator
MEFSVLTRQLELSDSVLSKHLARLMAVGYVEMRKASESGHLRTRVLLTDEGRAAYTSHIAALRELLDL